MDRSPTLRTLVAKLEEQPEHTPATLAAVLRTDVTLDDVAPWTRFDPHNYVRAFVAGNERWELRLLCWRPGQSSSFHAHGRAACAFRIVRGSAFEIVLGERDRVWTPGAVVEEDTTQRLVHQVGNASSDALLTLHAYSPPLPVDAPSPARGRNVVIVGGGFAGAAIAYHLLERGGSDLRVTLVERGPWLGRGVAYGFDSPIFRLNVPASRMSIDPARPDDFVAWAHAHETPDAFLSRSLYGAYVVERLGDAVRRSAGKLRVVRGDAVAVEGTHLRLADGRTLDAPTLVLATGLAPRMDPGWLATDARIVDAWDECALATVPREARVLVLGSGLTAIDVIGVLHARGHRGAVTVLSRRGLLPRPHTEGRGAARPLEAGHVDAAPRSLRELLQWGRSVVRETERRGEPWQFGIDAIRPHVTRLWQQLPPRDRARFARTVRPYWDVLRHRAPRDAVTLVEAWRVGGGLELAAGSVVACEPSPRWLEVTVRGRGGEIRRERFDAIVRCIGPALERAESETPLLASLLAAGTAAPDAAGLGIVTDASARLVGADGRPSDRVFALGALRRASAWETTAVPEIAREAAALAQRVLAG